LHDILQHQKTILGLQPEQERLDRQRRQLVWSERQRRYQVRDDVAAAERHLQEAVAELQSLGVVLLDSDTGRVGFPTIVNDRRAFFSWKPGDEGVRTWHFAEETVARPIPASWVKVAEGRSVSNG